MRKLSHQGIDQSAKFHQSSQFLPGLYEASHCQDESLQDSLQVYRKGVLVPRGSIHTKIGKKSVKFTDCEVIYCFTIDGRPVENNREEIKFSQQSEREQQKQEGLEKQEPKGTLLRSESPHNGYNTSKVIPFAYEEDNFGQVLQQTFKQESDPYSNFNFEGLQEPQFIATIQLQMSRSCQNNSEDEEGTVTNEDSPTNPSPESKYQNTLTQEVNVQELSGLDCNMECNRQQYKSRAYLQQSYRQMTGLTNQRTNETNISDHNLNLTNMAQKLAQQQSRRIRNSLIWTKRKPIYVDQQELIQ